MRGHAVIGESPVSGFVPRWIEGWLLPGLMLFRKKILPSDDWRFGFAFNKSFHNSLFWSWCQRSVFVLKRCSPVLIQYKKSRHMAGNSSTADIGWIRCWWDRLSPQWELLSQLGILSLLGQHFDIDQVPGMTCMKTIKKIKLFWKHMINHVFSRDFYSRMVLFTGRILIGSIVRYGVTCKLKASSGLTEVSIFRHSISTVEMRSNHNYLCECIS